MTTELEKQFFDTFGIEPKLLFYDLTRLKEGDYLERGGRCNANWQGETKEETIRRFSQNGWKVLKCEEVYCYPQITDKHYLELICILGYFETVHNPNNCEELKKYILDYYLNLDNSEIIELKHQVQAIF